MCWFPRRPGRLRIAREGYEHIIRCSECPGCLELNRRRLADRLKAHYQGKTGPLWLVRIHVPAEAMAPTSHRLHRRPGLKLEAGHFRLGLASMALLARDKAPVHLALRSDGIAHRIERIRASRGRRAWRAITAGILVSREAYGEQVKRWYMRGLAPLDKLRWEIDRRQYEPGYDRRRSPRAWTSSKLILVPPALWTTGHRYRRTLRALLRNATDPESVAAIIAEASGQASASASSVNRGASAPPQRDASAAHDAIYEQGRVAANDAAAAASFSSSSSPSERERYRSSGHTQKGDVPVPADIQAMIDRLATLAKHRKPP